MFLDRTTLHDAGAVEWSVGACVVVSVVAISFGFFFSVVSNRKQWSQTVNGTESEMLRVTVERHLFYLF